MHETFLESKIKDLERSCKSLSQENWRLKGRIRELGLSRDQWKAKSKARLSACRSLEKRVNRLEGQSKKLPVQGDRAHGHHYPLWMISLCLLLRQKGVCSLRVCAELMGQLSLSLHLDLSRPSPSSIGNWEKKLGVYHLATPVADLDQKSWCLFIDESLSIGQQKVLLLLGLNVNEYGFEQAPDFSSVELLYQGVASSWKAETIVPIIEQLQAQGHHFLYCSSDRGNNLVKSLKLTQIPRIADCTHAFSKLMEKRYKTDPNFLAFTQGCTSMRKRLIISRYAAILPPTQRAKARFLNLRRIAQWGKKSLALLSQIDQCPSPFDSFSEQERERIETELKWLKPLKSLIEELCDLSHNMDAIFAIIKHQGLSRKTQKEIKELLVQESLPLFWTEGVETYLQTQLEILPEQEQKICCCDIIESFFGKFKVAVSQNSNQGILGACLRMASFAKKTDNKTLRRALESISVKQVNKWTEENIPPNLAQIRKKLYQNQQKKPLPKHA